MSQIKKINILKPCHQSWQQMAPADQGRHCENCCKTVIDFTQMTDQEIVDYLTKSANVCGRFEQLQLDNVNNQVSIDEFYMPQKLKGWAVMIGFLGSITFYNAVAQTKESTVQTVIGRPNTCNEPMIGKVAMPMLYREIIGHVTDDANQAIIGALVRVPVKDIVAVTDTGGNFNLRIPLTATQFTVDFIGYNQQIVPIDTKANATYKIKLRYELLGEVVVIRQSFFKRIYYKLIKRPIRKLSK